MHKKYRVIKDNAKSLRAKSKPVIFPLSKEMEEFAEDLLEYLKSTADEEFCKRNKCREGVGLAAPQLGKNVRMLALNYDKPIDDENTEHVEMLLINPQIVSSSLKECYLSGGEGCLSVDKEHKGYVYRNYKITVKAYDFFKKEDITINATGFDAVVLQHEIDHLDGILFYDHIDKENPFKKKEGSVQI